MNTLFLELENPIDLESVDRLMTQIKSASGYEYIVIDVLDHHFDSIQVIKYFREELEKVQSLLMTFNKVAFVSPPDFQNVSENPKKFNYFKSKTEALMWLND